MSDISAGMVFRSRPELGNTEDTGVEALIDASEHVDEAVEVSAESEEQKVHRAASN